MSNLPKTYRVNCFDLGEGSAVVEFIKATTDEDAVKIATAQGFGSKCELWDGERLVAQLELERRQG